MMNPKTWPQQAKFLDMIKENGDSYNKQRFKEYITWLIDGIEPDEYDRPKDKVNRRPDALMWPREKNNISQEEIDAAIARHSQHVKDGLKKKPDKNQSEKGK